MLRNWARLWRGLSCFVTPRNGVQDTISPMGALHHFSHKIQRDSAAWQNAVEKSKDQAVPNASWSQEMMKQFNRYMEMTKDGSWEKLPSYRSIYDHLPEEYRDLQGLPRDKPRLFLRCISEEGMGFEYAMFLNLAERRVASVFQIGPYLEGPSGYAHGGAIATILDTTVGASAFYVTRRVMTANLNINYKSPVALGSVVLVDSRVDKVEGKKIFVSGEIRSVDEQILHAQATASAEGHQKRDSQNGERRLFIQSSSEEGVGFEHALFVNPSEILENSGRFANGGAIVTVVEHTVGASIASLNARAASINVNYKRPVALGSVVLVEARADRTEGRKVFVNFEAQSVDGQTLYAQGIVLCVKVQPPSLTQKETDPSSSP